MSKNQTMNRRTFISGSVASAGLIAATAAAPYSALASESSNSDQVESAEDSSSPYYSAASQKLAYQPTDGEVAFEEGEIAADKIVEQVDCDLVIAGAGMAGICAAESAAENGLSVVLLEKSESYQFQGGEIGSVNCHVLTEAGLHVDPTDYYNVAMHSMSYRCDGRVWQTYIDRSGEALDWFIDEVVAGAGGEWAPSSAADRIANGIDWLADVVAPTESLYSVVGTVFDGLAEKGVDVRLSTPAVQLVQSDDGTVTGLIAKNADGDYIQVNASATLLATGGYCHNSKMLAERIRPRDMLCYSWLDMRLTDTGDGILMGRAIGAAEDDFPHAMMNDSSGSISHSAFSGAVMSMMRVNENGERFVNEDLPLNYLANYIAYQPGSHDFCLADANVDQMITQLSGGVETDFTASMVEPFIADATECDSIESLAEAIGCDAATLQATLDRYNELCDAGEDEDFGKSSRNMIKIETPPFYAFDEGPANLSTVNGLRTTWKSEVIGEDGKVIPGLYASGNTSGSMFNDTYTHHLAGVSLGRCVTFGYLLGRRLAGLEE